MKFKFTLIALSTAFSVAMLGQRNCGTGAPGAEWDAWFNQKVLEHKQNLANGKTQNTNFTIPVIVHVIHGGQNVGVYPNISQAQINSQIVVMNNDYAGIGFNVGNLAATGFSTVGAADCSVSFCLAQLDPDGNTLNEWGIDRVNYTSHSWTNPNAQTTQSSFQNYMDGVIKPGTIWDPSRYFNIWVTDCASSINLLGYATFPTGAGLTGLNSNFGTAVTDGIWVYSKAFGSTGTLLSPYNKGRTATHEAGHYLGLRHIGGDGNNNPAGDCNATDYCADTPPQKGGFSSGQYGQNFGAPTYPLHLGVCPLSTYGDMFMNFMDYVDDAYCTMFTPDQSTRITTAMNNGSYRNQLTASSATMCNVIVSSAPVSSFVFPSSACVDSSMATNNLSTGAPNPSYLWSVTPAGGVVTPNTSAASPNIKFSFVGTYTVTMSASNSVGSNSSSQVVLVTSCTNGIKDNSMLQNSITLSPNPSSGIVNIITSSSDNQNLEITIHNYIGQYLTSAIFKDAATSPSSIDMSNYSNGVYFITINNGKEKTVKRLILNK